MQFSRVFGIEVNADGGVSSTDKFTSSVKSADKATGGLASKLGILDKSLTPVAAAIGAVTGAVVLGVKRYTEYEKALAEVNTLLSRTQSIKDYSDSIRQLAVEFGSDAPAQAAATYQIVSAGARDAAEATDILSAANKLAIGGVTDITTAADGLTTILNAYQLEASSAGAVSDILFSTMRSGKTTVGELSASLGLIVPTASQLGVTLPEVTAAIATLTTNGVATAQAVTQVNAALTSVLKPSKEAQELAAKLGLEFNVAALQSKGLAEFLTDVAEATGGSEEELAKLFGSVEAVRAVLPLAGASAQKFAEILESNENAAGATTQAYAIMAETTSQNFARLRSSVNELALSIGEDLVPVVNFGIDALELIVQAAQMSYDGLSLLADIVGTALVDSFNAWNDLIFGGAIELLNSQVSDTVDIFDVLGGVFSDTQLVGIALVRGLLLGWEELEFGTKVILASISGGFDKAFGEIGDEAQEFISAIADAMDELPEVFGISGDSLRGFAKEIRTSTDAADDFDKKMGELRKEHEASRKEIIDITDEMADEAIAAKLVGEETSKLTRKVTENTRTTETNTQSRIKSTDENKKNKETVESLTRKYAENKISVEKLERELEKLEITQAEVEQAMENSGAATDRSRTAYDNLTTRLQEQLNVQRIAITQGEDAARAYELIAAAADDAEQSIEEFIATNPEATRTITEFIKTEEGLNRYNEALGEIGQSLGDLIVDGGSIEDYFKDLWKRMVRDFLASGLTKLIGSLFSGNGLDFSGFTGSGGGGIIGQGIDLILGNGGSSSGGGLGGGNGGNGTGGTGGIIDNIGNSFGLSTQQTQAVVDGAGSLLSLYGGYQQLTNGNEFGGAIQIASGGVGAYNAYQRFTGGNELGGNIGAGIGLAGNALGIYNGIRQGGITGYGSAAYNAYQGYQTLSGLGVFGSAAGTGVNAAGIAALNAQPVLSAVPLTASGSAAGAGAGVASSAGGAGGQGLSALGTAGAALGVAGGLYGVYSGIQQGGARGASTAAGGALAAYGGAAALSNGALAALGPYGWAAAAVLTLLGSGGARDYDQILQEDYLPDLLGSNPGSAIGLDGALGFDGGNTGIFGANYGIQGSGLTEQFGANGGENGNYAFFTGAQRALDGFEDYLNANGVSETRNEAGTLSATSDTVTVERIRELWAEYAEGLDTAVAANEVFQTAVENGLISMDGHTKLFLENFAVGFGESAFEARDSLRLIDERFDEMVAGGMEGTDALFAAISERYGIAVEDAQFFVEQSGVSADQWVEHFTNASGEAIDALLEFDENGVTVFESVGTNSASAANNLSNSFGVAANSVEGYFEQFTNAANDSIFKVEDNALNISDSIGTSWQSVAGQITQAFGESANDLIGIYEGIDLGTPRAVQVPSVQIAATSNSNGGTVNGADIPFIGNFNSALTGSETIPIGGSNFGTNKDILHMIGVNQQEDITVSRKGLLENIASDIKTLSLGNNASQNQLVNKIDELIDILGQASNSSIQDRMRTNVNR